MTGHHQFAIAALWVAIAVLPARGADAPDLSGTWVWTWKDATGQTHRHVLEVEGTGGKMAARERFDDLDPVKAKDLIVDGKSVKLTVERGDHHAEYRGVLADANTINGTVTVKQPGEEHEYPWKAQRQAAPK